ncbi:MAG: 23S rRNA (pseudouridine(1915)-N(3))-methyltransferase RlmH [Firmicutes bacterium]|nr:23S rRNA (pseudouridine(1915)-N(3))-methyltransferase RlmH [Bacillota bacterium]
MTEVRIVCVGKLKEAFWRDACAEYAKRLSRFCDLAVDEVKEELFPKNASAKDEETVRSEEGKRLLERIPEGSYAILLDIGGKALSSESFAEKMEELAGEGKSRLAFVIGGSLGVSEDVRRRADFRLSFSKMTFPHQLMRVVLLEQIYRTYKIRNHETYHK